MKAEIIGLGVAFQVPLDGAGAPPDLFEITYRPCWRKPARRLGLAFVYARDGVAYYHVNTES